MEIRFLNPDDASDWLRLRLEALQGDPEAFSASWEEYAELDLEEVKKRLGFEREDTFVAGAFDDGLLVGVAGFYREQGLKSRHKGHVWGVYVTPSHRGKGLARQIMQVLIDRAAKIRGVEQVLLSVTTAQKNAGRLYRSLSFEAFGCEPRALKIGERYIDEEYMMLRLAQPKT